MTTPPPDGRLPEPTTADRLAVVLRDAGVRRLFGMPGGGSIAELIAAAGRVGLPFTLGHTEVASAFMAAAYAEVGGAVGVCLATLGPGAASLVNGVAHAWLDRVPLLAITDCLADSAAATMLHQTLPQAALFAPITKATVTVTPERVDEQVAGALAAARRGPAGPVHLDLSSEVAAARAGSGPRAASVLDAGPDPQGLSPKLEAQLRRARRPVLLLGLGARTPAVAAAVRRLIERRGIPALVTYKAKGVVPDDHPWFAGLLTNGALERPVLDQADRFLAIGLDPVELLNRPWSFPQPMVHLGTWPIGPGQLPVAAAQWGDLPHLIDEVDRLAIGGGWDQADVRRMAGAAREALRVPGEPGRLWPHRVVELVAAARPGDRVTVDAGAHMFPTVALWPAHQPLDLLISNGLASMGFALPAAIGATLADGRPVTAFTGDGGLLMCLAELQAAAEDRLPIRIVVFEDRYLSLIRIKQLQRGFSTDGTALGGADWPAVGESFGVRSVRVTTEAELAAGLTATADGPGPVLIAATIDPSPYQAMMTALRG